MDDLQYSESDERTDLTSSRDPAPEQRQPNSLTSESGPQDALDSIETRGRKKDILDLPWFTRRWVRSEWFAVWGKALTSSSCIRSYRKSLVPVEYHCV